MAKPILFQELSSAGCSHCVEFRTFWRSIEKNWPNVKYEDIDLSTTRGIELLKKNFFLSTPGIILNGELFSSGPVDRDNFLKRLKELS